MDRLFGRESPEPVRVAISADANYALPLAAAVRSIVDNRGAGSTVEIVVMCAGLTPALRRRLLASWPAEGVAVHFAELDGSLLAGVPTFRAGHADIPGRQFSPLTYARIFVGDLAPPDWTRVIYLDSDVIVCRDLTDLWHTPLDGRIFGAVRDPFIPTVSSRFGVANWEQLGLAEDTPYFNAGVMLIDLRAWREAGCGPRALEHARRYRSVLQVLDQECLNATASAQWTALPDNWNVTTPCYWPALEPAYRHLHDDVRIRHFSTRRKPWLWEHRAVAGGELYYEYLDRTDWSGWRPSPIHAVSGAAS